MQFRLPTKRGVKTGLFSRQCERKRQSLPHDEKDKNTLITFVTDDAFLSLNVFVWKTERRRFEDRSSVAEKKERRRMFFFFFRFEER